jgi:hypothetical protein
LAERIAQLPATLPAAPFYQQMEKIVKIRKENEERLQAIANNPSHREVPTELPRFETYLSWLFTVNGG